MAAVLTSSTESNVRLLRHLADIISGLPSGSLTDAVALLEHCEASQVFSSACIEDAAHIVDCIGSALSSDHSNVHSFALRVAASVVRGLMPAILAHHWCALGQRVLAVFKGHGFSSFSAKKRAQVFSCAAAITTAAAPCIRLGGDQKARAVIIGQVLLRHAIRTLSQSPISATLALSALSAIFSVVVSTPRELRVSLSQLDLILREHMLVHSSVDVRTTAAKLYAHLVMSVPDKALGQTYIDRISVLCDDLEDVHTIINGFVPDRDNKRVTLHRGDIIHLSAASLSRMLSSAFSTVIAALAVSVPLRSPFPISRVIHIICSVLYPCSIDPYAVGYEGGALDAEGALTVSATYTDVALATLGTLLFSIERDIIVPYAGTITKAFRARLKSLLLQVRTDRDSIATAPLRARLYNVIMDAITVLGSGVIEETVPLVARLLQTDVSVHLQCCSVYENKKDISAGNSALTSNPIRTRKRKRPTKLNENVAQEVNSNLCENLGTLYSDEAIRAIRSSFDSGLGAVRAMFECRGLISTKTCEHLRSIETLLMRCLEEGVVHEAILSAATAAAISGGSNRMEAFASKLLGPCGQYVAKVCVGNIVPEMTRRTGFSSRSMYEPLIHSRGPHMRKVPKSHRTETYPVEASHSGSNRLGLSRVISSTGTKQIVSASENEVLIRREPGTKNAHSIFSIQRGDQVDGGHQNADQLGSINQNGNVGRDQRVESHDVQNVPMQETYNTKRSRELDSLNKLTNVSMKISSHPDPSEADEVLQCGNLNVTEGKITESRVIHNKSSKFSGRSDEHEKERLSEAEPLISEPTEHHDGNAFDKVKLGYDVDIAPTRRYGSIPHRRVSFGGETVPTLYNSSKESEEEEKITDNNPRLVAVEGSDEKGEQSQVRQIINRADENKDAEVQQARSGKDTSHLGEFGSVRTIREGHLTDGEPIEHPHSGDKNTNKLGTAVNAFGDESKNLGEKNKNISDRSFVSTIDKSHENTATRADIDMSNNFVETLAPTTDKTEKIRLEAAEDGSKDTLKDLHIEPLNFVKEDRSKEQGVKQFVKNDSIINSERFSEGDGEASTETEDLNCTEPITGFIDQTLDPNAADQNDSAQHRGDSISKELKIQGSGSLQIGKEDIETNSQAVKITNSGKASSGHDIVAENSNQAIQDYESETIKTPVVQENGDCLAQEQHTIQDHENKTIKNLAVQENGDCLVQEQDIEITFSAIEPTHGENVSFVLAEDIETDKDIIGMTGDCGRTESSSQCTTSVVVAGKDLAERTTKIVAMNETKTVCDEKSAVLEICEHTAKCQTVQEDDAIPRSVSEHTETDKTRGASSVFETTDRTLDTLGVRKSPLPSETSEDKLRSPANEIKPNMAANLVGVEGGSVKVRLEQLHSETRGESSSDDNEKSKMNVDEDENELINSLCFDAAEVKQ